MATTKYQGFQTYRYAQIALKGSQRDNNPSIPRDDQVISPEDYTDLPTLVEPPPPPLPAMFPNREEELEVDYENDVTDLYQAISSSRWNHALQTLKSSPQEARTWVVRYKEDSTKGIMWRFLPIHSACARQPPIQVIASLIQAYSGGAGSCDDQGMYPLHYASGNQASAEVIRYLLHVFPSAANTRDPSGMLPIHYMAQWGPSEAKAIDILLSANPQTNMKDDVGNTPLHYAEEGDYPYRQEMIAALRRGPVATIPKKKTLPPMASPRSPRRNTIDPMIPKAPTNVIAPQSIASSISKLDDSSIAGSNYAAPVQDIYKNSNSDASVVTMGNMGNNTRLHAPSANKTVNKLSAQINKMKAEFDFHAAEYEETLTDQREQHEKTMEELNAKINKSIIDNTNVRKDLASKTEYGKYVEDRISEIEKDINHFKDQNVRLEKEKARDEEERRMEKSKAEAYQMRIRTLSSKMNLMIEDQKNIHMSLSKIENDMKAASEGRKMKLQGLYDEEMKYSRELATHKQVYGSGGPTILAALDQQKTLMDNCVLVLSECETKGYETHEGGFLQSSR